MVHETSGPVLDYQVYIWYRMFANTYLIYLFLMYLFLVSLMVLNDFFLVKKGFRVEKSRNSRSSRLVIFSSQEFDIGVWSQ